MLVNFDYLKTFYNALKQKMKNYRGNWNQNDSTADDYIKNRPFYSEGVKEIILIDSVASTESNSNGTTTSIYYAFIEDPNLKSFKEGQSYTVALDNVNYECTGFVSDGEAADVTLGNATLFDSSHPSSNNDAPFVMVVFEGEGCMMILTEFGDHPVVVKTVEEVVHKLDKKFVPIPDDVVSEDDLADVAFSGDYWDLNNTPTIYNDVVRYNYSQNLSTTQKSRARTNIGAGTSNFSGSYNDLTDKTHYKTQSVINMPSLNSAHSAMSGSHVFTMISKKNISITDDTKNALSTESIELVWMDSSSFPKLQYRGKVLIQTDHTIVMHDPNAIYTTVGYVFGNASLIQTYFDGENITSLDEFSNTGENYCYITGVYDEYRSVVNGDVHGGENVPFIVWISTTTGFSVARYAKGLKVEYTPLDEIYIPDTIARVSDVPDNVYTKEETYSKEEIYTKEETYSKEETYTKEEADAKFFSSDATVDEIANVVLERLPTWEGGSY